MVTAAGVRYEYLKSDITAPGAPAQIIDACVQRFGSLDILVNSAGICPMAEVLEFGRPQWDATVAVNLTAAFEMSYEAAKRMIPQRSGKIINICSLFSFLGGRWSSAYAATKHGIAGFTKAYCDELAMHNIQVNGIAPGYYATEITRKTRSDPVTNQRVLDHIPAERWGEPVDLMGTLVFLASRASNYVNGHVLVVDGGYLVR
jgi:NAD(P)-dependent dehydrogenase (short-subunit alcohol dehydrogenase family)